MANTKKARTNRFDEDITSLYELELPDHRDDAYDVQVIGIANEDEEYMLEVFHQQYVAVEGRSALAQLVDIRTGEMAVNNAYVMARTMEDVEQVEGMARLRRLEKRLQDYNNKLLDLTAKQTLETNAIAVRTIHEDMRRDIYRPPPPRPPRRKGVVPAIAEFLFGGE